MAVPSLPLLVESLRVAPVVRIEDYDYFVHPLTDGVPEIQPPLLREVVAALRQRLPPGNDRILTPEAMGIPLAAALALESGRPFMIARKRRYGLPGEITATYRTGYSGGNLHINGLRRGESIVIVDDVISRGGTIRALVDATRRFGARVSKVLLLVNKGLDLGALARELAVPIEALVEVRVEGGRVLIVDPPTLRLTR